MDDSLIGLLVLVGVIALNAFFKMAYVALINAQKATLKDMAENGHKGAMQAYALATDATRLLASQQIIDLLLRFTIAVVAAVVLVPPLRDEMIVHNIDRTLADGLAYGGVMLIIAITTLVLGEMLPTNIALTYPNTLAIRLVGTINLLSHILAPVLHLLQWISSRVAAPFVGRSHTVMVTEEEIKLLVDAGQEGGAIEDEEKEMIYSIFQFGDTLAREVMVPRIDMVALDIHTPLKDALNTIVEAGHSRIPVYDESIDHIKGLLYAKDLLEMWRDGTTERPIADLLRPTHFVPESKKAGDLLTDLQQRKIHLAVVVDEYGGTAGLVTIEDLIEEIVGEIRDEYDFNEEEVYQQVGENEYICDASIDLDDLNRLLDTSLPTDESDTLGGYIFSQLGKVPVEGETLETEDLHMVVLGVDDRRIRKIRLTRKPRALDIDQLEETQPAEPRAESEPTAPD